MIPPIKADLATYLGGVAAVSALIGDRLYPVFVPQSAKGLGDVYVVYQMVGAPSTSNQKGASDLIEARFQLDVYGDDYAAVDVASRTVDAAVMALNDEGVALSTTPLHQVEREGGPNDLGSRDGDRTYHRVSLDYIFFVKEV